MFFFARIKILKPISRFKRNTKKQLQNGIKQFQKNFLEAKNKPRSKRKALFLRILTVLGLFEATQFASVLSAVT